MKFTKNDEAVSPVIGVILMVAITVILAAVIAAFVFGMAGNISKTKVVAATAQQTTANVIVVTYQGGQDAKTCVGIVWTSNDEAGAPNGAAVTMGTTATGATLPVTVGIVRNLVATPGKDHVVGTAWFADGSQQVIFDSNI